MRHVAWLTRKICVPVIGEFIQRRDGVAVRIVWIVGSRPGVLKDHRESQPNVSLINSLNCVHDAQDIVVRGARTSQSRNVFKVGFGGDLNNFEWRQDLRRDSHGRAGNELFRFLANLLFERSTRFADVWAHIRSLVKQVIRSSGRGGIFSGRLKKIEFTLSDDHSFEFVIIDGKSRVAVRHPRNFSFVGVRRGHFDRACDYAIDNFFGPIIRRAQIVQHEIDFKVLCRRLHRQMAGVLHAFGCGVRIELNILVISKDLREVLLIASFGGLSIDRRRMDSRTT